MGAQDEDVSPKKYPLGPPLENLVSQAQSMSGYIADAEKASRLIRSLIPPDLPKILLKFQELIRLKNISIPFSECGLWLTPSMTPDLVKTIVEIHGLGKKQAIPAIIDGFYRRNNHEYLKRAVDSWSSYKYFSPRMHIFYDALDAHIAKKWTLTVPTLLPHVEGISGEIILANKLQFERASSVFNEEYKTKTYTSSLFGKLKVSKVTPTMNVIICSLLDYLEGTLYAYKNFEDYPKIRRLPKLNRHAILHGYQVHYDTRLNSLRCFLALDSLSMLEGNVPKLV